MLACALNNDTPMCRSLTYNMTICLPVLPVLLLQADIWSFGVCMWQLWTMQEPFEGVHLHALLHQLSAPGGLSLPVPGTPDWQEPECPAEPAPGWRQLMQRCWQQPAAERPSARQLVAALEEMMEALRAARRRTSEPATSGQR